MDTRSRELEEDYWRISILEQIRSFSSCEFVFFIFSSHDVASTVQYLTRFAAKRQAKWAWHLEHSRATLKLLLFIYLMESGVLKSNRLVSGRQRVKNSKLLRGSHPLRCATTQLRQNSTSIFPSCFGATPHRGLLNWGCSLYRQIYYLTSIALCKAKKRL